MKPQSLVEWISDAGVSCVTLTGGEPTLQPGLPALILALLGSDAWGSGNGRAVEIETNGAVDLSALHELRSEFGKKRATDHCAAIDGIDCGAMPLVPGTDVYFTVDCKMPSSGMTTEMLPGNYELLGCGDAVNHAVLNAQTLHVLTTNIQNELNAWKHFLRATEIDFVRLGKDGNRCR